MDGIVKHRAVAVLLLALVGGTGCGGENDVQGSELESARERHVDQTVEPPTPGDLSLMERRRKWVRDHYTDSAEARYGTVKGKLALLDTILRSGWVEVTETVKLQSLGITLGDAIAQERRLGWVMVNDEYGRDPALRLDGTSVLVFPLTMISKRVERGEDVDIHELFEGVLNTIEDARRRSD